MPAKKVNIGGDDKGSVATSKKLKISKAQEMVLLAVLLTSLLLGATIALSRHFIEQIGFNIQVISAKDTAVQNYSDTIKNVGVCEAPKGTIYSEDELKKCNPDQVEISNVQGSLRYNILNNLAANEALNAVPNDENSECINSETGKNYTYEELKKRYDEADDEARATASNLLKTCSAVRIVPDALPSYRNEEALLASLNKLFIISGFQPDSISPNDSYSSTTANNNLLGIDVNLNVDATVAETQNVLSNVEKSIREFYVDRATFEWSSSQSQGEQLTLSATATAYYVDKAGLQTTNVTISPESGNTTSNVTTSGGN